MNHKLSLGCAAGVAALTLAATGSTYAAFSDYQNLDGNNAGADSLRLDLGKDGAGVAPLSYLNMQAGATTIRTIWLSSHDGTSPSANLSMTFGELVDTPAPCDTALSKSLAETASGINGCSIGTSGATGTPAQGNLSRVLTFASSYFPTITSAQQCADVQGAGTEPAQQSVILAGSRGDLVQAQEQVYAVPSVSGTALVLHPGDGACLGISASWQPSAAVSGTPAAPIDAAAQGDSLSFRLRFELTQASDGKA